MDSLADRRAPEENVAYTLSSILVLNVDNISVTIYNSCKLYYNTYLKVTDLVLYYLYIYHFNTSDQSKP